MLHRQKINGNPVRMNLRVVSQKEFRASTVQPMALKSATGWQ
jgi:hypothetical protein